ncbi:MAG: phosphoadenosine phosphosulfate reductase family protein [Giesbergeria sp.]|nr:phosphoadenosine phosphosulfate reductase family protein [Giesbergeria sp.]MDD2610689.1 phosphoadenosine phosphosulfate reductase family protein [Giesbergeria sp.]
MQIVSYGGGVNSTAMLIEMMRRGESCAVILFADTGGERPETYSYTKMFSEWLVARGYPAIVSVQNDGMHRTLEVECLTNKRLPSVVFGYKSCSDKYKRRPFAKWLKSQSLGDDVTVCIGFDADEPHRAARGAASADPYAKRYPLIEWDMGRDECLDTIRAAGLPTPGKSACFFCPNSKVHEILSLPQPLIDRALAIESNAELTVIAGLGRSWRWADLIRADKAQMGLFHRSEDVPCGCYDG